MFEESGLDKRRLVELEEVIEQGLTTFVEVGEALLEIRDSRLYLETHGTFEDYCQDRWQISRPTAYRMIDAARVADVVSPIGDIANEAQARELTPLLDDETELLEAWREAQCEAEEVGAKLTAQVVRNAVRKRIDRVKRERIADERRIEDAELASKHGDVEIRFGDFREVLSDLRGTVDAIITDPPYGREYDGEYVDLAARAVDLLREDGALVVLCGTRPDLWLRRIPSMEAAGLPLRWVGCYLTEGTSWRDHSAAVATNWKPVLIFGGYERNLNSDVWRSSAGDHISNASDKAHHHWGQNYDGFARLVESVTRPGQLVVDPFLGGGTAALVCRNLGRHFVGCDIDSAAVAATRERLAA